LAAQVLGDGIAVPLAERTANYASGIVAFGWKNYEQG